MSKRRLFILLALALCLGAILFAGVMTMLNWDFRRLSTVKYETNEHRVTEAFDSIRISSDTARIILLPSEDGQTTVICHERTKSPHAVSVRDGVLTVELTDHRRWYDYIGLDFGSPTVTVRLPIGVYAELSVKTKTGGISVPSGFSFSNVSLLASTGSIALESSVSGNLSVKVNTGRIRISNTSVSGNAFFESDTGKITITHLTCHSLSAEVDTGDLILEDVLASDRLSLESDTGDVRLTRCDASDIDIETDTGSIIGTLLSEKLFDAKSDTGRVRTPEPSGTERCRLRTDTGRIEITLDLGSD